MATKQAFDVIIIGGGIAGSCLARVLARGGFGVLVDASRLCSIGSADPGV
jgi:flavin-dependent dehydrogenase